MYGFINLSGGKFSSGEGIDKKRNWLKKRREGKDGSESEERC